MGTPGTHARTRWPVAVFASTLTAGLVFAAAHYTSEGDDLRPAGGDVASLVSDRTHRVELQRAHAKQLQYEVDQISEQAQAPTSSLTASIKELQALSGLTQISGPGLVVSLSDAPGQVKVTKGEDPNVLVVHQQDIQGFVNALWSGGAQAITIQGQRLISTTGIKCVGSTVVLDGVPYSPPYKIAAVGNVRELQAALDNSAIVMNYRRYVVRYQLGLSVTEHQNLTAKAYGGTAGLRYASAITED